MSILLKISNIALGLVAALIAVMGFIPMPQSQAIEFTTESELVKRLSADLGQSSNTRSGSQVLGAEVSIPFFPRGYTYPIPALGNCTSQADCFNYCEDADNLEICAMTSFRNGKMGAQQLKETLTLASYIKAGYLQNCDDINSCVKLCDDENAYDECKLLASNISSGAQVLGVQDNDTYAYDSSKSILNQCSSIESCTNALNIESVIESSLAGMRTGQVLNVSDSVPVEIPSDLPGPTEQPPQYQPTNYLNCVTNYQSAIPDIATDTQQFNMLNNAMDTCGQEFSPAESAVENFASTGQERVNEKIDNFSSCVLQMGHTRGIENCLQ